MVRRSLSVTIERPVHAVFAVLSDIEQTSRWHPNTVREYWTSEGPVGVGSTRRAVAKSFGIRSESEAVVTVYEHEKVLGLRGIDSPIPFSIDIRFESVGDGTRVDWLVEMEPEGAFKLVAPLAIGAFMRQLESGLGRLKSMMESGEL